MERFKSILEDQLQKVVLLLIGFILVLMGIIFWQRVQPAVREKAPGIDLHAELLAEDISLEESKEETAELESEAEVPLEIMVDVKGAVHAPGVYIMSAHHRVMDAVEKAGGFNKEAEQNTVNLAKLVEDQMVIYIPKVGEEEVQPSALNQAAVAPADPDPKEAIININQAEKEALMTLNGIGPSKADSILSYREESGPFQTIEDIKNVSGIGEATFEKLKDSITVAP